MTDKVNFGFLKVSKKIKDKMVSDLFTSVSDKYDLMNDIMSLGIHRVWKKKMIDWMNPQKESRLIDVGSGTGDIAKSFLERIKFQGKVTCVEPNELMLKTGKKKLKNLNEIEWIAADAEKPLVETDPDHKISRIFKEMATKVKGSFL